MIKVDLHVHSKMSKKIPFSMSNFEAMVREARRRRLNGFVLVEHFHSYDYWDSMLEISRCYPYKNSDGCWKISDDIQVFSGVEITVADGADVVAIGPLSTIDALDRAFKPRLSGDNHPYLEDILSVPARKGLILIGAHPTRPNKCLRDIDEDILCNLDALELNGRDLGTGIPPEGVRKLAASLDLPVTSGSDAHLPLQVGVQYSLLPVYELSLESLRYSLNSGMIRNYSRPEIESIVKTCTALKKAEMNRLFPDRVKKAKMNNLPASFYHAEAGVS